MVEFNPDGSIKLPGILAQQNQDNENRLRNQRCIKIKREMVNFTAPKKCVLHITLSKAISDDRFISNIFEFFRQKASVPASIKQKDNGEYEVEIGTNFKRCSDCNILIANYREFLDGNLIDDKGNCSFQGRQNNFCYEDYFD